MSVPRRISIMGSTGSIGKAALSFINHANTLADKPVFTIDTLVAKRNVKNLARQAIACKARMVIIADPDCYADLKEQLDTHPVAIASGPDAVIEAARRPVDRVLAAIVGFDGLASTLAALEAGNTLALANKESMVCAGPLLKRIATEKQTTIIPTDSEHNAIFQVMERREDVKHLILTGSGGPFRKASTDILNNVTPAQALAHPRWRMGKKISVDSATLFNKGLELIEAVYLFDIPEERIQVVIHPQSVLHSAVAYRDGSVLAQMGCPDMRTPIAHALTWPQRRQAAPVEPLDLITLGQLDFETFDSKLFPAIALARTAIRAGGAAPTILNCSNEAAVAAFLAGHCRFSDINLIVEQALEQYIAGRLGVLPCDSLDNILHVANETKQLTNMLLGKITKR